ncbi:MAG TPA: RDD family protein [Candidatus Luteococcus avicola]|nr:RDD family protein [Candidatus Luteococcus avicola]
MTEDNQPTNPWRPNLPEEPAQVDDPWRTGSTPSDDPTAVDPLAPNDPWASTQQPAAANDPWGNTAQEGTPAAPVNPWGNPQEVQPTTSTDQWGAPADPAPATNDPWGSQQGQQPTPTSDPWGSQPTTPASDPWGAQQSSTEGQWGAPQQQPTASDQWGMTQQPAEPHGQTNAPYVQTTNPYGQAAAGPANDAAAGAAVNNPWQQNQGVGLGYGQSDPNAVWGNQPGYGMSAPVLASFGKRVQGYLLDYVPASIVLNLLLNFDYGRTLADGTTHVGTRSNTVTTLIELVIFVALAFLNKNGQTPGRRWAKTQLVDEQGQPLQAGVPSLPRYVAHLLDSICFLGWLWPLWDTNRQTFADKIAKTRVIDLEASRIDPNQR